MLELSFTWSLPNLLILFIYSPSLSYFVDFRPYITFCIRTSCMTSWDYRAVRLRLSSCRTDYMGFYMACTHNWLELKTKNVQSGCICYHEFMTTIFVIQTLIGNEHIPQIFVPQPTGQLVVHKILSENLT